MTSHAVWRIVQDCLLGRMTSRILRSLSPLIQLLLVALLMVQVGCEGEKARQSLAAPLLQPGRLPSPVMARLQPQIEADLGRYLARQQASVSAVLAIAETYPVAFKRPLIIQGLVTPWTGMQKLENAGWHLAKLATPGQEDLPEIIQVLESGMGRTLAAAEPLAFPRRTGEDSLASVLAVLDRAKELREKALRNLSREEKQFLFAHAGALVERFVPQVSELTEQTAAQIKADWRFCQLVAETLDYSALVAAARVLAALGDEAWLEGVASRFGRQSSVQAPSGITGEVLLVRRTEHGLVVVGGVGPNTYELDGQVAAVIDLGGDDTYRGTIAAPANLDHGVSLVIDLAGNDTYLASPLGLATGRLGIGLLIDRGGNDRYFLSPGSGGTGFAGLGILYDMEGNDLYIGSRFTQGAAIAGLGMLLDRGGQDTYTSFGYAIGFGGPLGVGVVLDAMGDDWYQCGETYPSLYNLVDTPGAAPGDAAFQYDAFGIGTGSGRRVLSQDPRQLGYALGGGWGLMIDLAGHDHYRSSNFSQGAGYFFGAGVKLDFGGNDEHQAARYSHGASAHFGVALFIDAAGEDRYGSTGPVYNGGVAWDRSVSLCIDAGVADDLYEFRQSDGLGRADHNAWSVFIEEGGRDRYIVPDGMGKVSDHSLSGFFDLAGEDTYVLVPQATSPGRGNGRTIVDLPGALFLDR